jgi:hypothetical protein
MQNWAKGGELQSHHVDFRLEYLFGVLCRQRRVANCEKELQYCLNDSCKNQL